MAGYSMGDLGANICYVLASSAFPLYLTAYGLPNWLVGFLAQERSLVGAVVQPVIGAMSDRLPATGLGRRRPFLLVGVPGTAVSLILLASHPSKVLVFVLLTAFSLCLALAYDPYQAALVDITPELQRAAVGGVMALFRIAGQVLVVAIAVPFWVSSQELVFALCGLGMVLTFGITWFATPWSVKTSPGAPPRLPSSYVADLLGRPELVRYLAATGLFWLGMGGVMPFLTRFGVDILRLTEEDSFLLLLPAAVGISLAAASIMRWTHAVANSATIALSLLALAVTTASGLIIQSFVQATVAILLLGVAFGAVYTLLFPLYTTLIPPERAGEFTGIGNMVWSLAQPLGALLAGLAADLSGSLRAVFVFGSLSMLLALLAMKGNSVGKSAFSRRQALM